MARIDFEKLKNKSILEMDINERWAMKRTLDAADDENGGVLSLTQQQMKAELDREMAKAPPLSASAWR